MSHISNVKIVQSKDGSLKHDIFIDGKQINNVADLQTLFMPNSVPEVYITINSFAEFEGIASPKIVLDTESIRDCIRAIRFELNTNDEFYNNLADLIASELNGDMTKARDVVKTIAEEWEW